MMYTQEALDLGSDINAFANRMQEATKSLGDKLFGIFRVNTLDYAGKRLISDIDSRFVLQWQLEKPEDEVGQQGSASSGYVVAIEFDEPQRLSKLAIMPTTYGVELPVKDFE